MTVFQLFQRPFIKLYLDSSEEGILTSSGVGGHERSEWTDYELLT